MAGKACVFVDGENLRHAIVDLFPNEFDQYRYLPEANWDSWFDNIVESLPGTYERFRSYWYVAGELDCFPHRFPESEADLKQFLSRDHQIERTLRQLQGAELRRAMAKIVSDLKNRERKMRSRFNGWRVIHNAISTKQNSIEFRTAGYMAYNAFTNDLKGEKAVDVNLAIDLVVLRDIYDIAVIVSGDGDYVPAVQVAKDAGKKVVNISFLTRQGKRLPGGAPRLNRLCDCSLDVQCEELAPFLNLKLREESKLI